MLTMGGGTHVRAPLPDYEVPPILDAAAIDDLDRLGRRNIVATDAAPSTVPRPRCISAIPVRARWTRC